jgi:hypothetical protein
MGKIIVANFQYKNSEDQFMVNVTSRGTGWGRSLSPFLIGPIKTWDGTWAQNMENLWQYSKVYEGYSDSTGPNDKWYKWAHIGWAKKWADRYPMGRGIKPLYSFWNGEKLSYVEARRKIYIPEYSKAVIDSYGYGKLEEEYLKRGKIVIQDFDAHNICVDEEYDFEKLIGNENIKVGHGYVLAMMLLGIV